MDLMGKSYLRVFTNSNIPLRSLYIALSLIALAGILHATSYDQISVSTATDYKAYQNLGHAGPDATGLNISNISEYSQTLLLISNVPGSFQYPGQKSLSVFYVLNPFELNEVANAMQPSANTIYAPANTPPSQAYTLINVAYGGPSNTVSSTYPLRVFVTGYTNTSSSYGGFAPYTTTYSNVITTNSGTLIIPELYNVTGIYLNRPLMGQVNVSVWDVSYKNPSNAVELAYLNSIPGGLILYGPDSSLQDYYSVDPGNMPIRYDNSGYSSVNFTLVQNANPPVINAAQQFYAYYMNTIVNNTTAPATFAFGIVNSSVGAWSGIAPTDINYTASSSNTPGAGNHVTYISPGGPSTSVQAAFSNPAGSNVVTISPQALTFNLAEINESYISPQSATLVPQPSSATVDSRISLNATVEYGKAPYAYDYIVFNAMSNSVVANIVQANQLASNTYIWIPSSTGIFYANVVVTDADSNSVSSAHTGSITVDAYAPMSTPTISSSATALAVGHSVTFNAAVSGGAVPYTYNFAVYNSASGALLADRQYNGIYQGAETFVWNATSPGTVYANVVVTDSYPNTVSSAHTAGILIENLTTPAVTESPTVVDTGHTVDITAKVSGGTPPYTYNFIVVSNPLTNATLTTLLVTNSLPQYTFTWYVPSTYPHTPANVRVTVTDGLGVSVNSIWSPYAFVTNVIQVGGSPDGLSLYPSGNTVYVNDYNSDTINVINTSSASLTGSLTIPAALTSPLMFNPSGSTAYGISYWGGSVYVINTTTMSANAIDVGLRPSSEVLNPADTLLYVTNTDSNTISVISTATNTIIATISGLWYPGGIAISQSGSTLYVSNGGAGTVSVIDTSTNSITNTIRVGSDPGSLAISPSGTLMYVTNYGSGTVSVIDTGTDTVTNTIGGLYQPYGVVFNPAGTFAYVTNPGSSLYIIDTATSTIVYALTVTEGGFGSMSNLLFNRSGYTAYIADSLAGVVRVVSPLPYLVIEMAPSISLAPTSESIYAGQSINFANTIVGGTPPYSGYNYTVFEYGSVAAGTANAVVAGNKITFNSTGTYDIQEHAIDDYGIKISSANSVITVSTPPPSGGAGSGSSAGSGGGSGGGGGGGGQFLPSVISFRTNNEIGYRIFNFTQHNQEKVGINGIPFTIVENFISPNAAGITVNGASYTLGDGETANLTNYPGYHIGLLNISYLPIIDLVEVEIYQFTIANALNVTVNQTKNTTISNAITRNTTPPPPSPVNVTNQTKAAQKTKPQFATEDYQYAAAIAAVIAVLLALYFIRKRRPNYGSGIMRPPEAQSQGAMQIQDKPGQDPL